MFFVKSFQIKNKFFKAFVNQLHYRISHFALLVTSCVYKLLDQANDVLNDEQPFGYDGNDKKCHPINKI